MFKTTFKILILFLSETALVHGADIFVKSDSNDIRLNTARTYREQCHFK